MISQTHTLDAIRISVPPSHSAHEWNSHEWSSHEWSSHKAQATQSNTGTTALPDETCGEAWRTHEHKRTKKCPTLCIWFVVGAPTIITCRVINFDCIPVHARVFICFNIFTGAGQRCHVQNNNTNNAKNTNNTDSPLRTKRLEPKVKSNKKINTNYCTRLWCWMTFLIAFNFSCSSSAVSGESSNSSAHFCV